MENIIFNEDCLEGMKNIPEKSIDMVLCDMPYGTTRCKWDVIIDLHEIWKILKIICKKNAAILLFSQMPFSAILVNSNLNIFRYEIIWEKALPTGHLNANKMPMKAHENILVFYEVLPKFNPQMTISKFRNQISRGNNSSIYGKCSEIRRSYISNIRYPRSVQYFSNEAMSDKSTRLHPTQKPVALCEYLIKTYTNENDTVLDFCMGSGTTAIACLNTNRNYIGFEKDKEYFDISLKRIENHQH